MKKKIEAKFFVFEIIPSEFVALNCLHHLFIYLFIYLFIFNLLNVDKLTYIFDIWE